MLQRMSKLRLLLITDLFHATHGIPASIDAGKGGMEGGRDFRLSMDGQILFDPVIHLAGKNTMGGIKKCHGWGGAKCMDRRHGGAM